LSIISTLDFREELLEAIRGKGGFQGLKKVAVSSFELVPEKIFLK